MVYYLYIDLLVNIQCYELSVKRYTRVFSERRNLRYDIRYVYREGHIFGTDTPVAPTGEQLTMVKQLDLSPSVQEQILRENSNELFHLDLHPAQ